MCLVFGAGRQGPITQPSPMIVNLAAVPLHLPKLEDEQQGALHLQLLELWPAPQTFSTRACRKGQGSRLSAPACPCRRASTSRVCGPLSPASAFRGVEELVQSYSRSTGDAFRYRKTGSSRGTTTLCRRLGETAGVLALVTRTNSPVVTGGKSTPPDDHDDTWLCEASHRSSGYHQN